MLLRNSLWHAAGAAVPALVALATIPLLVGVLGTVGFGWLTLVTSIVGYFGALDINLTAGAIKYLSEAHATGDKRRVSQVFWLSASFYGALGVVVCLIIGLFAGPLADVFGQATPDERPGIIMALRIGAIGFAIVQIQSVLISVLQALLRYDLSARSEMLFGVAANIISVLAALAGLGLEGVVLARVAVSTINCAYLVRQLRVLGVPLTFVVPDRKICRDLLSFSAYAYLSKLASTLHQHGDKLIVGALGGPVAVTLYTVPITLAGRVLGMTGRLSSVIFPHASALSATSRIDELRPTYLGAIRHISYLNFVVCAVMVLAGDEFLRLWVGESFVAEGYPVLVLMAFALLADSLTNIPSLVNDALGHPRISGAFAVARGISGLAFIYFGMSIVGIVGAAAANLFAAVLLGAVFLIYVHGRTVPISLAETVHDGGQPLLAGLAILIFLLACKWLMPAGMFVTGTISLVGILALLFIGFSYVLRSDERAALKGGLRHMLGR
jgi:O-antigen/teichoic acid export membrane protein